MLISLNSVYFDYLIDHLRRAMLSSDVAVSNHVFRLMDEGGLDIISAKELDRESFMTFLHAVTRAAAASKENPEHARLGPVWDELKTKIGADPRADDARWLIEKW
ncbi:hypothetical protein [Rhizobacter sp. LjRoot28]|uniref:hypothetical protein n=1 Tax=Rhizobacter sp. LjRoot28 TaxID=3342309 RepID=UPI003ECD52B8